MTRGEGSPLDQARRALELGALKRAEYLLKQIGDADGEGAEAVLNDLMRLAELWQQSGKTVRAARLYGEVIERMERLRGDDTRDLIDPLRKRANALLETDLPHEQSCDPAEDCLRRALRLQDMHFGPGTLDAGWMLLDLTDLLQDHERCDDAEALARQAWDIGRSLRWDEPALFFEATDWLVWWYEAHQEWHDGAELLERSLELSADLFGSDHPRIAELMGALANMMLQDGRDVDEADQLCARGLEILVRSYGELPVSTDVWPRTADELAQMRLILSSLHSIRAHAAFMRNELRGCHYLLNRALLMLDLPDGELSTEIRASLAAAHGTTYQALAHLATEEGNFADAERLFQRALSHAEQADPDRCATLLEDYAAWLEDRGRNNEAEQLRREAEDLRNG